ncbi:MAG: hypothetical protein LUQ40_01010, partial [Methanomicrobiales archaeon]|nr:hypothetical protein [Methanomicrobiales archaeon]
MRTIHTVVRTYFRSSYWRNDPFVVPSHISKAGTGHFSWRTAVFSSVVVIVLILPAFFMPSFIAPRSDSLQPASAFVPSAEHNPSLQADIIPVPTPGVIRSEPDSSDAAAAVIVRLDPDKENIPQTPYNTGPANRSFSYFLRGTHSEARFALYNGVYEELENRFIRFDGNYTRYYHAFLDDPLEETAMDRIIAEIQSSAQDPDDQLRCAVSLVQNIPYGTGPAEPPHRYHNAQYPYETLYENSGVCEDKSLLLASILRRLGFGVVLFKFDAENHMAVGVRCADAYDFRDSGYAFIETTIPSIITDDQGNYASFGSLSSMP